MEPDEITYFRLADHSDIGKHAVCSNELVSQKALQEAGPGRYKELIRVDDSKLRPFKDRTSAEWAFAYIRETVKRP